MGSEPEFVLCGGLRRGRAKGGGGFLFEGMFTQLGSLGHPVTYKPGGERRPGK